MQRQLGSEIISGSSHCPPSVQSHRGCCGPGRIYLLTGRSIIENLDLMTMKTIKNKFKDQERIKFRDFLDTQDDSLASTID